MDVVQPSSSQEHHSLVNKHQPVPATLQRSWNLWPAAPGTWMKSNPAGSPGHCQVMPCARMEAGPGGWGLGAGGCQGSRSPLLALQKA
ncbi:hypothetical protein U0070_015207 [Myodes glareolus]|uniref:Uncharacterized protein n=1 Tax=Myodes glareolus TaxID=447135 RepID=A0AAW0HA31_MYOGA